MDTDIHGFRLVTDRHGDPRIHEGHEYLRRVTDLFESIVLFDNQATTAVARKRPDGRYDVTMTARARKLRANGEGVETEAPIDEWIDIGVFGEVADGRAGGTEKVLYLRKQRVTTREVTVTATVDGVPFGPGSIPITR